MFENMMNSNINLKELISTGTTFEADAFGDDVDNDDEMSNEEYQENVLKHVNMNCVGQFEDEDIYDSTEPFTTIASKMTDLVPNGGIKKRILREGYGHKPENNSIVRVHYNAYGEFNEEPFDCTYARNKPHQFVLGQGQVIPGLDLGVESMKVSEKSQFMIKPQYAYGEYGCLTRIPPNSTVLFEVELVEVIESTGAHSYDNLPVEEKSQFPVVYKYCLAQCAKGKDLFNRNLKAAIREYNMAVSALENAVLEQYDDQVKQQELLYKLYSNLLVCHTKIKEPKRGCINFNKINQMCKGTDFKVTAKAFYNNAKCLTMLGDYKLAKDRLQCAFKLEPRNPDILSQFEIIDDEQRKYKEKEKKLAGALFVKN